MRQGCVGMTVHVSPGYEGISHVDVQECTWVCLGKWACAEGGDHVFVFQ